MKFEAHRTSVYESSDDPVFPGAYAESCLRRQSAKMTHVQRWFVDIDTPEHLMTVIEKAGFPLIIEDGDELPSIEIYDGWRE